MKVREERYGGGWEINLLEVTKKFLNSDLTYL